MNCKIALPMKLIVIHTLPGTAAPECRSEGEELELRNAGLYTIIELLFRGHSHPSMFILGGLCFILIGGINKLFPDMSLLLQMGISAAIITVLEFICGCIVNLWLLMDVWNYEEQPFNILGQVCLIFTVAWFFLSLVGIVADDFLRWKLFCEEKPKYKII